VKLKYFSPKKVVDAEQLALENSEHLATLVKLFEVLEAKYLEHENKTQTKEMKLEESIEEVSAERDHIKGELEEVKSEFFHRDQKITSLELELSNQLSCNHELEEQILELRNKLELNEIVKMRQNDLERSYERIKVDIARVTDERDEYRSLAESLKSHQTNTGLMEQSIAIGPIWPSSPSPIPIRSYGGSASNLMTQSCHPGLSGDSPANASPSCLPEGPAKEKDADDREHFQVGDSVLVIFNKDKKQYVLHTTGLRFYFVHEGCFEEMGLEKPNECTDTEICLECEIAEKPVLCVTRRSKNRYSLPSHTKFYRVKVRLADD